MMQDPTHPPPQIILELTTLIILGKGLKFEAPGYEIIPTPL
jgi:hypothetical protein